VAEYRGSGSKPGKILTTHAKRSNPFWYTRAVLLPGWDKLEDLARRTGKGPNPLASIYWGWKLFRESRSFEAVATGAEHPAHVFAFLQKTFRNKKRRKIHVLIDFPWNPPGNKFKLALKRLQWRHEITVIDRIVLHSALEQEQMWAEILTVPVEKFQFVQYHETLYGKFTASTGDYIFAGGDPNRDYDSLIEAVRGLPVRLVICARNKRHFDGIQIPENVEIMSATPERFNELLAGSRMAVVALKPGKLHSGGHTVVVNALTMGKPLVIAEDGSLKSYVTPGVDALMVPAGDYQALRNAITNILNDNGLAQRLSENAKLSSARFTPEAFFSRVFVLIDSCALEAKRGYQ